MDTEQRIGRIQIRCPRTHGFPPHTAGSLSIGVQSRRQFVQELPQRDHLRIGQPHATGTEVDHDSALERRRVLGQCLKAAETAPVHIARVLHLVEQHRAHARRHRPQLCLEPIRVGGVVPEGGRARQADGQVRAQ